MAQPAAWDVGSILEVPLMSSVLQKCYQTTVFTWSSISPPLEGTRKLGTRDRRLWEENSEFRANLGYITSSRLAWAT